MQPESHSVFEFQSISETSTFTQTVLLIASVLQVRQVQMKRGDGSPSDWVLQASAAPQVVFCAGEASISQGSRLDLFAVLRSPHKLSPAVSVTTTVTEVCVG